MEPMGMISDIISLTESMSSAIETLSAQTGFGNTILRLKFELDRADKLFQILESTANSRYDMSLASPGFSYKVLGDRLGDIRAELDDLFDSHSQNSSSHRTMRMVRSFKYRFKKKEINKTLLRIGQLIDSLYLTHSSIKLESLHPEIAKLRNDIDKMNMSADDRFQAASKNSPVGDKWDGPTLSRLYTTSLEGLKRIKKILNSAEIDGLIERLQVWGTCLFEGPLQLDGIIGDDKDPRIHFLTGCFARICLNIQIIGITLESQDEGDLLYLKELSLLLKNGDARYPFTDSTITFVRILSIPTITLAKIDSDVNMTAEEKLLKYFDNIEDDLDLLYEMLPVIYIARQLYNLPLQTVRITQNSHLLIKDRHRYRDVEDITTNLSDIWFKRRVKLEGENIEREDDAVEEKTLSRLVDEDIELANELVKSLRIQGKKQPAKFEKFPMEATVKLFEAEIHTLEKWRTERGKRITDKMVDILRNQTQLFRVMDNATLDTMGAWEVRQLLEKFQATNILLHRLSANEASAEDSKKFTLKRLNRDERMKELELTGGKRDRMKDEDNDKRRHEYSKMSGAINEDSEWRVRREV